MSLLTDKERNGLEKAYKRIARCKGNCKDCKRLLLHTCETSRGVAYAWECTADGLGMLHNYTTEMKMDILRQLIFELS